MQISLLHDKSEELIQKRINIFEPIVLPLHLNCSKVSFVFKQFSFENPSESLTIGFQRTLVKHSKVVHLSNFSGATNVVSLI